ncbi:hypothetical protein XH97_02135 [Bradyrhizobium sp. CCBAU 53380]|nr:hypothetical protein [Bradyrhizobium sp. CCBAU 53380]
MHLDGVRPYLDGIRPYLTLCIDAATRMPLGHHLSFEPPSVCNALHALRRAIAQEPMPPLRCRHLTLFE